MPTNLLLALAWISSPCDLCRIKASRDYFYVTYFIVQFCLIIQEIRFFLVGFFEFIKFWCLEQANFESRAEIQTI